MVTYEVQEAEPVQNGAADGILASLSACEETHARGVLQVVELRGILRGKSAGDANHDPQREDDDANDDLKEGRKALDHEADDEYCIAEVRQGAQDLPPPPAGAAYG